MENARSISSFLRPNIKKKYVNKFTNCFVLVRVTVDPDYILGEAGIPRTSFMHTHRRFSDTNPAKTHIDTERNLKSGLIIVGSVTVKPQH